MQKYWWVSWYQPTEDIRPLKFPPGEKILGWWNTGYRCDDGAATIVSKVIADAESHAKEEVIKDWPEAQEWRFCDETDGSRPGDRFPLSEWMEERFTYLLIN